MFKRFNRGVVSLLTITLFFGSCLFDTKQKNTLEFFIRNSTDYGISYDSARDETLLDYYIEDKKKQESLIFNYQNKLVEYVFYNSVLNEPRFILKYDDKGWVVKQMGKPIYVTSENFQLDKMGTDSFCVFVYMATPPLVSSSFSIFREDSSFRSKQVETNVRPNSANAFIGKLESGKPGKYVIISQLKSLVKQEFIRFDTVHFTIKK